MWYCTKASDDLRQEWLLWTSDRLLSVSDCRHLQAGIRLSLFVHPSIAMYILLSLICWNLTTQCLAVSGRGSVGECGRLSQLLLGTQLYSYT